MDELMEDRHIPADGIEDLRADDAGAPVVEGFEGKRRPDALRHGHGDGRLLEKTIAGFRFIQIEDQETVAVDDGHGMQFLKNGVKRADLRLKLDDPLKLGRQAFLQIFGAGRGDGRSGQGDHGRGGYFSHFFTP